MREVAWKPIFKILHWGVAVCIVLDYFWLEDAPHAWVGYLAVSIILLRIVLEFFFNTPKYANLLAKIVYFSIWTLILALAVTGWMMSLDEYWGDERLEGLHIILSNVLVGVILIHFAGLIRNALWHRQNTWKGMLP